MRRGPERNWSLQYVGKIVVTPVAYSAIHARELADVPFVDAERVAYRSPAADLVYQREMPALPADELATAGAAQPRGAALAAVAMHGGAVHAAALQPAAAATAVVPSHASLVVAAPFHPQMEEAIRIQDILRQKRY